MCATACPVGALSLEANGPVLQARCLGCGQCAAACVSGALTVMGFPLPARLPEADEIGIDCWRVALEDSPPNALRVPCLAGIGLGWLLALYERAHERPLLLIDRGQCGDCPAGAGIAALRERLDEACRLLLACGIATNALPRIVFLPAGKPLAPMISRCEEAVRLGRRSFFRQLTHDAIRQAVQLTEPNDSTTEAIILREPIVPLDRLRMMKALSTIAERHGRALPAGLLPQLSLSECSGHGICARVCPTKALVREERDDGATLAFHALRCLACGECVRHCPDRALRMQPAGGSRSFEVLAHWQGKTCSNCGSRHYGNAENVCAACHKEQQLQQCFTALRATR